MNTRRLLFRLAVLPAALALAITISASALAQKPKGKSGGDKVTELFNEGVKLQNEGQVDAAIEKYTEAINASAKEYQSLANRGGLYRAKGIELRENVGSNDPALKAEAAAKAEEQFALSVADYDAAIKISPTTDYLFLGRAATQSTRGKYDLALADYDEYIKLKPNEARGYNDRGTVYNEMAKVEKASEKSPDAGIKKSAPTFDKAIADFSKAVELDPKYVLGYVNRASCYTQLLKLEDALADFAKALEIDPNYWRAYRGRSEIYRALADDAKRTGDSAKAAEYAALQKQNYDKYIDIQSHPPVPTPTPAPTPAPKKK